MLFRSKQRVDHLKNFGFVDEVTVVAPGINGKMSEVNAAFGLLQLQHIDRAMARRAEIDAMYRPRLAGVRGLRLREQPMPGNTSNHSYFPVMIGADFSVTRDEVY